jgi:beta-galactosidase
VEAKDFRYKKISTGQVEISASVVSRPQHWRDNPQIFHLTWTVHSNGHIECAAKYEKVKGIENMPRIGLTFQANDSLDQWSWFGRGPFENYRDRNRSAFVGVYSLPVDEMGETYVKPQENGNRTDVRWAELANASGNGIKIRSLGEPLNMKAIPYTDIELHQADYSDDLPKTGRTFVYIDAAHMGLGNSSCGPRPMDQYRLSDRSLSFGFSIDPIKPLSPKAAVPTPTPAVTVEMPDYSASSAEHKNPSKNAFDGDHNTRWCAANGEAKNWLCVDYKIPTALTGVEILWEQQNQKYGYVIEGSDNGNAWQKLAESDANSKDSKHRFDAKKRFYRVRITKLPGHYWASIRELMFDTTTD